MSSFPIYVLARTPDAETSTVPVKEWTEINGHAHIHISHNPFRDTSRWVHVERKRPFLVKRWSRGRFGYASSEVGSSATIEGAVKIAQRYVKCSPRA